MDDKALTNLFEIFGRDTDLREIHRFLKTDSEKFKAQSKDFRIEIRQIFVDYVPLPFIILNFRYEEKLGQSIFEGFEKQSGPALVEVVSGDCQK
jgi:hypothetical protein